MLNVSNPGGGKAATDVSLTYKSYLHDIEIRASRLPSLPEYFVTHKLRWRVIFEDANVIVKPRRKFYPWGAQDGPLAAPHVTHISQDVWRLCAVLQKNKGRFSVPKRPSWPPGFLAACRPGPARPPFWKPALRAARPGLGQKPPGLHVI